MKKVLIYISWLTIGSALVLLVLCIYWLTRPYKLAEFKNLPFPIMNKDSIVERGDRVRYKVNYCKYTNQMPYITKYFVDGVVFETPKTFGVVGMGCGEVISDAYVPKAIPAGEYHLTIVASYKVNPIRNIEVVNTTQKFIVK